MTRCSHCQNFVADEMAFCTNCGQPLEFETVLRPAGFSSSANFEYKEIPKDRTILKITGVIGGLMIFGGIVYLLGRFSVPASMPPAQNANANSITYVMATPPPAPRTPEPTPIATPKRTPRPRPTPEYANSNTAYGNYPPAANIPAPRIMEYDKEGRQLRAICNNGEPSYWQYDKWATCGMNGGVRRWNPNHPRN